MLSEEPLILASRVRDVIPKKAIEAFNVNVDVFWPWTAESRVSVLDWEDSIVESRVTDCSFAPEIIESRVIWLSDACSIIESSVNVDDLDD